MINRNTTIGKMIDNNRVVYQCIKCNRKFIGDITTPTDICPGKCGHDGKKIIVIVENLVVTKGA